MSKLDELIKELCPNGVEYKELGEYLDYIQPTKYIVESTDYKDEYNIPVKLIQDYGLVFFQNF